MAAEAFEWSFWFHLGLGAFVVLLVGSSDPFATYTVWFAYQI
jgi:hypothetical protein